MNRRPNPFPVLDYERNDADNYRDILADHGHIEPYVDEMDYWVQLPVRVVHGCLSGVVLEVGPYTFDGRDIARLRAAIAAFDRATA